ncbi:LUD domain-containing protein [Limnoraphis robusta Tam1]|uniref:LutC/YkgG family protein n=1 Tax=Limnoraphis robusta TaxID=1118279 RepID=UPI002B213466|nr:LUD domain-containing protein [Limnoraphis robusta]MEA5541018.1 LUD domain-containing protein [Limnoraphis robusta Tam1]
MNSRDLILSSIRKNQPNSEVNLPEIPIFNNNSEPLISEFQTQLARMGGQAFEVENIEEIKAKITELYPDAKMICSTLPEITGNKPIQPNTNPHELADVDLAIIRGQFGVAENGAIWLTHEDLVVNALGFLSQHLIILLDSKQLVRDMHQAYQRIELTQTSYGVFMAGPSATGDVEAVIIRGAQGVRSLTVFLL